VRRARLLACAVLTLAASPLAASAHRLAPALLELIERGDNRVDVSFKVPEEQPIGYELRPELPESCSAEGEPQAAREGTGIVMRWSERCASGLVGARVGLSNLESSGSNALLRVQLADGRSFRAVLDARSPSFEVPERESRLHVVRGYAQLGVHHILTGFDHLLFVFGLVLLVHKGRRLLWTITAFTLGHSVTLSLAALGFVHFPSAWIEVLIAGTILWLAAELARGETAPEKASALRRRPWLMAGAFGLLHGLGFAGALAEVGLPEGEIPLALLSFNVGIECGQLAFVAVVLAAQRLLARPLEGAPGWLARAPVTAMGALAAYWCFERAASALGV
jgi:hydrogenase/urease accessory protein HupE